VPAFFPWLLHSLLPNDKYAGAVHTMYIEHHEMKKLCCPWPVRNTQYLFNLVVSDCSCAAWLFTLLHQHSACNSLPKCYRLHTVDGACAGVASSVYTGRLVLQVAHAVDRWFIQTDLLHQNAAVLYAGITVGPN
jgi:hypothetical protein